MDRAVKEDPESESGGCIGAGGPESRRLGIHFGLPFLLQLAPQALHDGAGGLVAEAASLEEGAQPAIEGLVRQALEAGQAGTGSGFGGHLVVHRLDGGKSGIASYAPPGQLLQEQSARAWSDGPLLDKAMGEGRVVQEAGPHESLDDLGGNRR